MDYRGASDTIDITDTRGEEITIMAWRGRAGLGKARRGKARQGVCKCMAYKIRAVIEGVSPILMHSASVMNVSKKTTRGKPTDEQIADEWMKTIYFNEEDGVHIPERNIRAMLTRAATDLSKGRQKLGNMFAGGVIPDLMCYPVLVNGKPIKTLDTVKKNGWILAAPVVIQRNRIVRVRACLPKGWSVEITLDVADDQIDIDQIRTAFKLGGAYVGLGDWRPQKRGPYGRFELISIERI